jgi:hypothetical protein
MNRLRAAGLWMGLILGLALGAGCLPNRAAVSPDGKTFYFSLNDEGGYETRETSRLYALDIETGRLATLTGPSLPAAWCTLSSDGRRLVYMTGLKESDSALSMLQLGGDEPAAWPLTGVLGPHMYPWMVPGDPPRLLAVKSASDQPAKWVAYLPKEVTLALPADAAAGLGTVGLAENRCAVTVYRPGPPAAEGEEQTRVASVWVVDFTPAETSAATSTDKAAAPPKVAPAKAWPVITQAAQWPEVRDTEPVIDLAFSADGKRLVAALMGCGGEEDATSFVELDPAGKLPPKPLFDDFKSYAPELTPDGKALVYIRTVRANEKFREVVLRQPDAKAPIVLARFAGEFTRSYTTWHWMLDGRLRIYHISEEGVRLVETGADGQGAKARLLARDRLKAGRQLADIQFALGGLERLPRLADEPWAESYAAKMKAVETPLDGLRKPTAVAVEEAWKSVAAWVDVPALEPVTAKGPDIIVPDEKPSPAATPSAAPAVEKTAAASK